jgi:hypothetical protein
LVRRLCGEEVTEPKPDYNVTMDVMVIADSWEARLVQKARQMRSEWLRTRRRMILLIDLDGNMYPFQGEPCGRIETG